jgi:Cu(I)/Ag(I) efflux system membrane fusion protein
MTSSSRRYFFWGLALGAMLYLVVLGAIYLAGFHLRFIPAASAPTTPLEHKPLCYVSPTDPSFLRFQPGKDRKGQDLIPIFPKETPPSGIPLGGRRLKYWVSPMDPKFVSDKPGKDPMGMDLVPVYEEGPVAAVGPKKERRIKYWVDPMDPRNISDKPGKAPCGMALVPVYEEVGEAAAPGTIAVEARTLQSMGVRTAKVEVRPLARTIRAVGRVTYDERRLAQVTTKVNGWVDRLFVKVTGDPIHQGQPLLSIYSPELVSTQQEYLLALKNLKSLENAPYPELGDSARRLLDASRRRLEYWDIPPSQIEALEKTGEVKKDLALASPVPGIVIKRLVTQGQMVQAGMPLLEVADLTEVWVEADIYEYELPWVKVGEKAQMTLSYLPGETFTGKIEYLYPYLKGSTRTAKVRLRFANPKLSLKPEMYAQVEIKSPLPQPVVAVPSEAVLDSGARQLVFIALGKGRFEPREVRLGAEGDGGLREVLSGLQGGEEVVVSAQFLLDSESRIREAVAKMLRAPAPEPGKEATPPAPVPPKEAPPSPPPVHKH